MCWDYSDCGKCGTRTYCIWLNVTTWTFLFESNEARYPTGNKDTDLQVLLELPDEALVDMCTVSREFKQWCSNEYFWELRSKMYLPVNTKLPQETWKSYYKLMKRPREVFTYNQLKKETDGEGRAPPVPEKYKSITKEGDIIMQGDLAYLVVPGASPRQNSLLILTSGAPFALGSEVNKFLFTLYQQNRLNELKKFFKHYPDGFQFLSPLSWTVRDIF